MRLSDIISLGKQYFVAGTVFAVVLMFFILIGYFVIYKKIFRGEKRITKGVLMWFIVFICYLFVVAGVTMLSRGSYYSNTKIEPLFYSYKEAWNSFEPREWRNIILNILLFVPFGFLLPLGMKWFRQFWKTYLAGFLFTFIIEALQFFLRRGIFELDDIFDNAIGAMIGYGCFAIVRLIVLMIKRKPKSIKTTLVLQLPLMIVIASFTTIFVTYVNQELGNLSFSYISKINGDNLKVDSDEKYSTNTEKLTVYKTKQYSQKETHRIAEGFFDTFGDTIDESRTDLYDGTAVYYSVGGYSYWIDYLGGTYHYSDYNTTFAKPSINTVSDATEEVIQTALKQYGIKLPDGMNFANNADGTYTFTANNIHTDGTVYDGTFTCTYYENGKMGDIRGNILQCESYKDFSVMSEADAYKMIEDGKFRNDTNYEKIKVKTGQVSIQYRTDSKGYCQPVYVFQADINGNQREIDIPAIK